MSMHIGARPGEIAEKVLLPGDPLRARHIAENYMTDSVRVNEVRNMWAYTGLYRGQRITVFPIGMGVPSAIIYTTELCRDYGCRRLVRLGTCGAYRKDIVLGDILLAQAVSPTNNITDYLLPGHLSPIADFALLSKAYTLAKAGDRTVYVGNMVCNDVLYFDNRTEYCQKWLEYGVLGQEMEGAGVYSIAAKYGAQAVMMASVVVNYWRATEQTSSKEKEEGLDTLIRLALDTVAD